MGAAGCDVREHPVLPVDAIGDEDIFARVVAKVDGDIAGAEAEFQARRSVCCQL